MLRLSIRPALHHQGGHCAILRPVRSARPLRLNATCRKPSPLQQQEQQQQRRIAGTTSPLSCPSSHTAHRATLFNEQVEYESIEDAERLELYGPGGYHPIVVGDTLHGRYRVVDKLGHGAYSTIWLAHDEWTKRYVAAKVGISDPQLRRREPVILRTISACFKPLPEVLKAVSHARGNIPVILDDFEIQGPNGTHPCHTTEPTQGNLRTALFNCLFPIQAARALSAKLAIAVSLVHSQGFVHGDLHSRNVLVKLTSDLDSLSVAELKERYGTPETVDVARVDGKPLTPNVPTQATTPLYLGKEADQFTLDDARGLMLSDFGEAFSPAHEERLGRESNTPAAKKAPEALFEPNTPISYPSDIWSLGTAIWEILGMKFIFSEGEPPEVIAAQQMEVLGSEDFPPDWKACFERPHVEKDDDERPRRPPGKRRPWPPLPEAFEQFVQETRREWPEYGVFDDEETRAILDLMRAMLKFRPEDRLTIDEVLRSEWMVTWALPELAKSTEGTFQSSGASSHG